MNAAQVLGANVRRLRRERGWTQGELAYRISVTRPQVANIEAGRNTTVQRLEYFARALGVEPWELLIPHEEV